MSIYSTWLHLNDTDHHEPACARWVTCSESEAKAAPHYALFNDSERYARYNADAPCTCGHAGPLVYAGSHVSPSLGDLRGGAVEVGIIPNHCHPEVRGLDTDDGPPVEFLRLCVDEDPATYHGMEPGSATVVLSRAQVEELRDTLTQWLEAKERW